MSDKGLSRVVDIYTRSPIEAGSLGFIPRCLVLTSLPHSRPLENRFVRTNGNVTVSLATTSSLGLPYGIFPRKLLISITTEAVRTQSPNVSLGSSLRGYLRSLGIGASGGKNGTWQPFQDQARRLFGTVISIEQRGSRSISQNNMLPVEQASVWWQPQDIHEDMIWEACITLSDKFFHQIMQSPIPLDWRVVQALSPSSLAIDVYTWGSYRRSKAAGESLISWSDLQAQFGGNYSVTPKGTHNFKRKFTTVIGNIAVFDPEMLRCLVPQKKGLLVKPGRPHVPRSIAWG